MRFSIDIEVAPSTPRPERADLIIERLLPALLPALVHWLAKPAGDPDLTPVGVPLIGVESDIAVLWSEIHSLRARIIANEHAAAAQGGSYVPLGVDANPPRNRDDIR